MVGGTRHHRHGHLAELFGLPAARRDERIQRERAYAVLEDLGLGSQPDRAASAFPVGSQKIIEVARALLNDPVLLLLDEPAAGLGAEDVDSLVTGLNAWTARHPNSAVMIIEHDLELITRLCPTRGRPALRADHPVGRAEGRPARPRRRRGLPGSRRCCWRLRTPAPATAASRCCTGCRSTVDEGEIVTVLGPNGTGKTSLMRLLSGVLPLWSGRISFDGAELGRLTPDKRRAAGALPAARGSRASSRRSPSGRTWTWAWPPAGCPRRPRRPTATGCSTSSRSWPAGSTSPRRRSPAASSRCWRSAGR